MICPHCGCRDQKKLWEDNLYWGCNACGWSSVGIVNTTTTPSNARPPWEGYYTPVASSGESSWGDDAGD